MPVLGCPKMLHWVTTTLAEQARSELEDDGRLRRELWELQQRLELGEVDEQEYDRQEQSLLERLSYALEAKKA